MLEFERLVTDIPLNMRVGFESDMQRIYGTGNTSVNCHFFCDNSARHASSIADDEVGAKNITLHIAFDLDFALGNNIAGNC